MGRETIYQKKLKSKYKDPTEIKKPSQILIILVTPGSQRIDEHRNHRIRSRKIYEKWFKSKYKDPTEIKNITDINHFFSNPWMIEDRSAQESH